jgi:metal-responsive CopG/Arc/MetJ family transcriptional regulator
MKTAANMKRLSASISDRLYDRLEDLAKEEGRSVSNLVAYLLERSVDARFELNKVMKGGSEAQ